MAAPRSLFRTAAVRVFALVLGVQLMGMAISGYWVVWPLLKSSATDLAALMVLSGQTWNELPDAVRPAYLAELTTAHRLTISQPTNPLPGVESHLPVVLVLAHELSRRLDAPVVVHTWQMGAQRWYGADLPFAGTVLRLSFPAERIGTRPINALLVVLAVVLLAGLLPALILARQLSQPLARLGQAAEAVGRGETPQVDLADAPAELAALARRFNIMSQEVQRLLHNRSLMLAGLSHDLRTPLARARMALELGREDPAMLSRIEQYLDDLNHLIQQYIDFARSGQTVPPEADQPLLPLLKALCLEAGVSWGGDGSSDAIAADYRVPGALFTRILRNLIDNAQHYGRPPIEVLLTRTPDAWVLHVRDHGTGIAPAQRAALLEPFARGDTARTQSGSGLGLAIVTRLCADCGWSLELDDTPGGGLWVKIGLPLADRG
ncbi:ATP-binding protein [Halothiobacillus sp. DCM-1]|uniref:ATP-binding protein n=1 Tax=Halothiobacillus sp. DCM-1 TaxID=3112558 RepID=UPI00324D5556